MKKSGFILLALLYLVGVVIAVMVIRFLWDVAQIPEIPLESRWQGIAQGMWKAFFSRWIPITYIAFTGVALILSLQARLYEKVDILQKVIKRLWVWERWSYLGVPLFWLLQLTWRWHGDWYLAFGIFFLGLVALKTIAVLITLGRFHADAEIGTSVQQAHYETRIKNRWLGASVFSLFCVVYGLTSVWQTASISTTGDEPFYLLVTHSLVHDGDLDLRNNLENEDYRPFYWWRLATYNLIQGAHGEIYAGAYTSGLSFLLAPGYFLLRRLGVTLTLNLFAALMVWELWKLTKEISGSLRPALWSAATVGLTMPILGFAPQVYPEIAGAWLFLLGLRSLRHIYERRWSMIGFGVSLVGLPLLKSRLAALSVGLLLTVFLRKGYWHIKKWILLGAGSIAVFLFVINEATKGLLLTRHLEMRLGGAWWSALINQLSWKKDSTNALFGMFFDQEFGLIWLAPFYLLSLSGIPMLIRKYRREVIIPLFISLLYMYPMLTGHAFNWWGGWSMPGRYWIVLLPLFGMFSVMTVYQIKNNTVSSLFVGSVLWSVPLAFIITLVPILRYNYADGTTRIADLIGGWLHIPFARMIPSLINPLPEGKVVLWVILFCLFLCGIVLTVRKGDGKHPQIQTYTPSITNKTLGRGALFLILVVIGLIFSGSVIPTFRIEGESMRSTTGIQYNQYGLNVWVMKNPGTLSADVVLSGGLNRFEIDAASYTTDPPGPHLELWVDGMNLGECGLPVSGARWKRHNCIFEGNMKRGRARLELRFTNGLDDSARQQFRYIYVDRILIN